MGEVKALEGQCPILELDIVYGFSKAGTAVA